MPSFWCLIGSVFRRQPLQLQWKCLPFVFRNYNNRWSRHILRKIQTVCHCSKSRWTCFLSFACKAFPIISIHLIIIQFCGASFTAGFSHYNFHATWKSECVLVCVWKSCCHNDCSAYLFCWCWCLQLNRQVKDQSNVSSKIIFKLKFKYFTERKHSAGTHKRQNFRQEHN